MAAGGGGVADPFSPAGIPCAFSPQSQAYFALASTDGHLRVWETASNRLHQEYVPSAHLSGTCTCLAWAPARLQAKVKRAGWRGAGGRSGSASALRGPAARDPALRVALRGPRRGGTERGGGALGPHRQPRAWPVLRATREGAARSDGQRTGALLAGSMWSGPSRRGGRHVLRGPGSPRSGFLLPGLALLLALFRALAFDRTPRWGCIVVLRPLPSSSAFRWVVRMNKSISLLPDTPLHPPLLGAGSPRVLFHV